MYPLNGGNPYRKKTYPDNISIQNTLNTSGTYLNKLDKFNEYQRKKQEKRERKQRMEKTLNELHLDFQIKETSNFKKKSNPLTIYDSSPKLLRRPLNNYLKKSENEKLKETILNLKTEIIELKIENHTLKTKQTKHQHFMDDLEILIRQTV